MKKLKNNLDERQEQAMLRIEHNGCWFAFWGLFVVMVVEYIAFGYKDVRAVAGEWFIFMILAIYLAIDCTKNGIFDRRLKPTMKTYIVCSLIGGVVAGAIFTIVQYRRFPEFSEIAVGLGTIMGGITFVLIFVCLKWSAKKIKDQEKKAEEAYEEE